MQLVFGCIYRSWRVRHVDLARQVPSAVLVVLGSKRQADDGPPLSKPVVLRHAGHPMARHRVLKLVPQVLARAARVHRCRRPPGAIGARVAGPGNLNRSSHGCHERAATRRRGQAGLRTLAGRRRGPAEALLDGWHRLVVALGRIARSVCHRVQNRWQLNPREERRISVWTHGFSARPPASR